MTRAIESQLTTIYRYQHDGVYALGDCASITDPHTGKPYPPTAQHAIRQGEVAAKNIVSAIKGKKKRRKEKEIRL